MIEKEIGKIDIALFNAVTYVFKNLMETSLKEFSKQWEVNCRGGFIFGKELAKRMIARGSGSLFFTGSHYS